MTSRSRGSRFVLGASAGAAAGALAMSFWPGASAATKSTPLRRPHIGLEQNKRPLSRADVAVLSRWANRYHDCARAAGARLEEPRVAADEILIAPAAGTTIRLRDLARCDAKVGAPPRQTSIVLARDDGVLHLFRPKTCALPPRGGP